MLTSTTYGLAATALPVSAHIQTPITTIPTPVAVVNTVPFNQTVTDSGCCTPTLGVQSGPSTCCGPNVAVPGYNVANYSHSRGVSDCCGPNLNTNAAVLGVNGVNPQYSTGRFCTPSPSGQTSNCCGPNYQPRYATGNIVAPNVGTGLCGPNIPGQPSSNCCAPSVPLGVGGAVVNPGYNTTGFCGPNTGGPSNCCNPLIAPNGVVTTGGCTNPCGPSVLVPGTYSPGVCGNLCGPSVLGGNITDCFSPTIARPGNLIPTSNNCCTPTISPLTEPGVVGYNRSGAISNCCGPSVSPNGVISQGICGNLCGPTIPNTIQIPAGYSYNQGGFCSGPTGLCSCCEPDINSTYVTENKPRVRGGIVSKEVTLIDEIPNVTTYIAPQINSTIQPVMAPLVTETYVTSPAIVETAPVDVPQINLNPTENLSPEAFAILQAISDQLPVSNLGIQFSTPVYLNEKQGIYVGQWVGESMNGYGKLYFDNGGYFEGQFVNGIAATANGCFVYPDGSYYIGGVSNNFANGQGVYTYKNNTLIYKGTFVNDQPEGRGVEYYADDSRYEGDFRFGRKEGRGTFYWRDGTVYTGQFEGGFMQGYGVHRLSNGEIYEGEFRKNRRHGVGKLINSLGTYNGGFRNDSKEGEGRFEWLDGRVFQGGFRNGKPDGPATLTLANGKVVNGVWVDGVLDTESLSNNFTASQIGSFGAIGGTSIIHNGGSLLQGTAARSSLVIENNLLSSRNLGVESSNLINSPFPQITSRLPALIPNSPPNVTPLFGSRVGNTVVSVTNPIQPQVSIGSGINLGIPQALPNSRINVSPVNNFVNLGSNGSGFGSGFGISRNLGSSFNVGAVPFRPPVGLGLPPPVLPLNITTQSPVTPRIAVPHIASPVLNNTLPAPIPATNIVPTVTPVSLPSASLLPAQITPSTLPVFTLNTIPIPAPGPTPTTFSNNIPSIPVIGSFGNGLGLIPPSSSPFLGGSLNNSYSVPTAAGFGSTSITPNITGAFGTTSVGVAGTEFAQTSIAPNYGFGGLPTGLNGVTNGINAPSGITTFPASLNGVGGNFTNRVSSVTPGLPSFGLPAGLTGVSTGFQTNNFSAAFPGANAAGVNRLSAVTPVGAFGTAPVGIPFVSPTGVPPVAVPRAF